jgi:hypothetical protein
VTDVKDSQSFFGSRVENKVRIVYEWDHAHCPPRLEYATARGKLGYEFDYTADATFHCRGTVEV